MSVKGKVLAGKILVKPQAAEEKTVSGIIIPDSAKEKSLQGEVVLVGADKKDETMEVKVGDVVLYGNRITSYNVCYTKLLRPSRVVSFSSSMEIKVVCTIESTNSFQFVFYSVRMNDIHNDCDAKFMGFIDQAF